MMNRLMIFISVLMVGCGQKKDEILLSPSDFQNEIKASRQFVLIDVRTPPELQSGYLQGAHNLDFKNEDFRRFFETADKEDTYLVYCASGIRSGKASDIMKELGFEKVYTLEGGLNAWREAGLSSSLPKPLPSGFTLEEVGQSVIIKRQDVVVAQLTCHEAVNNYCTAYRVSVGIDLASPDGAPAPFYSRQEAMDWVINHLPAQQVQAP
jgi:rhodanese-related sulfurtransferase